MPGPPSSGSGGAAAPAALRRAGGARSKISGVFRASSHRDSRGHVTALVMMRKTNRRHTISDHHGWVTGIAASLLISTDGIPGTHSAHSGVPMKICGGRAAGAVCNAAVRRGAAKLSTAMAHARDAGRERTVEENMSYGEWAPERATGDLGGE